MYGKPINNISVNGAHIILYQVESLTKCVLHYYCEEKHNSQHMTQLQLYHTASAI